MIDDIDADIDVRQCEVCGKVREHRVRRIDHDGAPQLCNECHEERHKENER